MTTRDHRTPRSVRALSFACALLGPALLASPAGAMPYTQPAPPMSHYIQSLGFLSPTSATANLDANSPEAHTQLEAYLLEGATAGAATGDPVLLAWFAAADASLAPWSLTNCGDTNYMIGYDCPWPTQWQVGLGCQVTDDATNVPAALAATHPGETAQAVGQAVLDLAAQSLTFPSIDAKTLAQNPAGSTGGMGNAYWLATLMRDMALGAYLESPPATQWPCYQAGAPSWCGYYRQQANWQSYSDALSEVINSWNQIQANGSAALVPDVIVDDYSSGFTVDPGTTPHGIHGWRGRFVYASAGGSVMTGTWTTPSLPAGVWHVSIFSPYSTYATAKGIPVTIHASDGPHTVSFDEGVTGGKFTDLGDFHFDSGPAKVTMTNQAASGLVGWDAVRFHAKSFDPAPMPSSSSSTGASSSASTSSTSGAGSGGSGAGSGGGSPAGSGGSRSMGSGGSGGGGATPAPQAASCHCRMAEEAEAPGALALLSGLAIAAARGRRRRPRRVIKGLD